MRGAGGSMKKFVADRPFADPDAVTPPALYDDPHERLSRHGEM